MTVPGRSIRSFVQLISPEAWIRIWIVLFFVLRLYGITNPPVEIGHAWRQCLTNMIARNLSDADPCWFYPRVDHFGPGPGIIGAEFPLLNGLIAWLYGLFGPAHWYGRPIVLVISCLGTWCFSRIVAALLGPRIALWGTLVLLTSLWFQFSRKIMPDVFSASLVLAALYSAMRYLKGDGLVHLVMYAPLLAAGGLSKMPSLCLGAALIVPLFLPTIPARRRMALALASIPPAVLIMLWYFHWVPLLLDTWHVRLYFPRDLGRGFRELFAQSGSTLEKFYFEAFRSFAGSAACLAGLAIFIRHHRGAMLAGAALITLLFAFFMLKAGDVFSAHSYYMVPYVPLMCVMCALAIDRLPARWPVVAVMVVCAEGFVNQAYDLTIPAKREYLSGMETLADRFTRRTDPVIVNGDLDPQWMYFLHRRGWSITDAACDDAHYRDSLVQLGAVCLFRFGKEQRNPDSLPVLYRDANVLVLDPR